MFIHSTSTFLTEPVKDGHVLKDELKRYTQVHFRRVNKFVILSLIGAHQCVFGHELNRRTSIYLTTERGNLGDTENVLHQIYRKQSLPMPYNFINTMSNTASFYVSQGLNVEGRNISISSQNLSFERGLELMMADLSMGLVQNALIGGVDEANLSELHFERKYGLSYESVRHLEGSCWLYIRSEREGAIGEISAVK
jgi:3-oxoacyl-(acyl-carrier-protein) synthase